MWLARWLTPTPRYEVPGVRCTAGMHEVYAELKNRWSPGFRVQYCSGLARSAAAMSGSPPARKSRPIAIPATFASPD